MSARFHALRRLAILSLGLLFLGSCGPAERQSNQAVAADEGATDPGSPGSLAAAVESWQCRNDLEVRCSQEGCEAETGGGFTPMSVHFDSAGAISVCAYSGCWEGTGDAFESGEFLVLLGHSLEFSTAGDSPDAGADVAITLDRADGVATLKVGEFAHPLLCESAQRDAPQAVP